MTKLGIQDQPTKQFVDLLFGLVQANLTNGTNLLTHGHTYSKLPPQWTQVQWKLHYKGDTLLNIPTKLLTDSLLKFDIARLL